MRIIVVSLDRAHARRRHTTEQLSRLGLQFEFFSAVDGARGEHHAFRQYDEQKCIRFFGKALTPGGAANFASQYSVWQRCVEYAEPIVVMEDDLRLKPDFPSAVATAEALMSEYSLIRLFGQDPQTYRPIRFLGDFTLARFLRGPSGSHCYALSPQGARILLANASSWREPIDNYISRFWTHGLPSVGLLPYQLSLAGNEAFSSDIRNWERKSTPYTPLRKIARWGDHMERHIYNIRQYVRPDRNLRPDDLIVKSPSWRRYPSPLRTPVARPSAGLHNGGSPSAGR